MIFFSEFCTKFPEELKDLEVRKVNFPLEVITSNYVTCGTSIRDSRAREVTVNVRLVSQYLHIIFSHSMLFFWMKYKGNFESFEKNPICFTNTKTSQNTHTSQNIMQKLIMKHMNYYCIIFMFCH
jgi:hypothetical protein